MHRNLAATLLAVAILLATVPIDTRASQEPLPADGSQRFAHELRYSVDMGILEDEFRTNGTVTLQAPELGWFKVEGFKVDLGSEDTKIRWIENGKVVKTRELSTSLRGFVVGLPESHAVLTLGNVGVQGTIDLQDRRLHLQPVQAEDGTYLQQVLLEERDQPVRKDNRTFVHPAARLPSPPQAPHPELQLEENPDLAVEVSRVKPLTAPWTADGPGTLGVFLTTQDPGVRTVLVEGTFARNGTPVAAATSTAKVSAGGEVLANLTTFLEPGSYAIEIQVHPIPATTDDPLASAETLIEVSMPRDLPP